MILISLVIQVPKKNVSSNNKRKITKPKEVFELDEVQEIKDACQEHLLFIGMNVRNNINTINIIGIGTSHNINVDSKYIVRMALVTDSDKVILVHNHPSGEVEPSKEDIHMSQYTSQVLKVFNIELVDHIIVSNKNYESMKSKELYDENYKNIKLERLDNILLLEENKKLKNKVKNLKNELQKLHEKEFEF